MPPLTTPDLVLFAIHATLKASHAIKKGIADGIRQKSLVLPLPDYDSAIRETTIEFYFEKEGNPYVSQIPDLEKLHEKAKTNILNASEINRYQAYYQAFKNHESDASSIISYFSIKNLDRVGASPTLLSLIAGNLVSTGIEFYQFFPEKIHPNHFTSNALNGFMQGLDQIPFSEGRFDQKAIAETFFPNLFIGISEWAQHSEPTIQWHPRTVRFIQEVTQGVGTALLNHPSSEKARWGSLIFHAFLSNASVYLQTNNPKKVVQELAGLTLSLLDQEKIWSPAGLDLTIRSALSYSGQVLSDKSSLPPNLKNWLSHFLKKLSQNPILHPAILPEVIGTVLEAGGDALAEKWQQNPKATNDFLVSFFESSGQLIKNIPHNGWPQKEEFLKIVQKAMLHGLSHAQTPSYETLTDALLDFQHKSKSPATSIYLLWSISLDALLHHQMYLNQPMPGFVFQTLFDHWLTFESLFWILPAQKKEDLITTLSQYYYNEIHAHSPIKEDKCQQIMKKISQIMANLPQPFIMTHPEEIIKQLETS